MQIRIKMSSLMKYDNEKLSTAAHVSELMADDKKVYKIHMFSTLIFGRSQTKRMWNARKQNVHCLPFTQFQIANSGGRQYFTDLFFKTKSISSPKQKTCQFIVQTIKYESTTTAISPWQCGR